MAAPRYTQAELLQQMLRLMRRGDAWPRDPNSNLVQLTDSLMPTMVRVTDSAADVLDQSLPGDTVNMLEEWQETLALPDPYEAAPTLAAQQAQVLARFLNTGGQSRQFFTEFAATLGYTVVVQEFMPWLVGLTRPGGQVNQTNAQWYWRVVVQGVSSAPDLEFELGRISPANTTLVFLYQP